MSLTLEEKVTYLANLIAVSRADGAVSPNEAHMIEMAQKRIGARKNEMKKAEVAAQVEGFTPKPVGAFSVRVANLEDMIAVSFADGVFDKTEMPIVGNFAKQIGITSDQLKLILSEIRRSFTSPEAKRACPGCKAMVSRVAKFCPECGVPLDQADKASAVAVEYKIPSCGITVEFAESTAAGFLDAVKKAKAAPENAECIRGAKTWYMASWPKDQITGAAELAESIGSMKNRKVWVDGKECRWDDVFSFVWCSARRDAAYRPIEYCFGIDDKRLNIWGCRNARLDWTKWGEWFSYGGFKKVGVTKNKYVFVFDKKRIRHELETNLFRFRFCPHLDFDLVEAVLKELPDEVEVCPDGDWVYRKEYDASPGAIMVKEKIVDGDYSYYEKFYTSGVVPRNSETGLKILKRAMQKTGFHSSGLKGIFAYSDE